MSLSHDLTYCKASSLVFLQLSILGDSKGIVLRAITVAVAIAAIDSVNFSVLLAVPTQFFIGSAVLVVSIHCRDQVNPSVVPISLRSKFDLYIVLGVVLDLRYFQCL